MPQSLAISADPLALAPDAGNATELAFYHDYVDHYRIAEHYFHGNLLPDERNDFQTHLASCVECADRVLLAEFFDQESTDAKHLRAAKVLKPTAERTQVPIGSEAEKSPRPQRISRLPSEARTQGPPPVPTPSDSAALQSLLASISTPGSPRSTTARRSFRGPDTRTTSSESDRPSPIRLVPREESGVIEHRVAPVQPIVKPSPAPLPVFDAAKTCSYLAERPGSRSADGSPKLMCNLPVRARWVASFTPLELALILGFAALMLLAIPSAIFLWN